MKRTFFCILWSLGFFIAAALILGISAGLRAGDDPEAQRLAREASAQRYSLPAFFGSIGLAVVLSIARVLPGTRVRRASKASATNGINISCERTAAGGATGAIMEHQFTLLGFIERWARTAPSGLVFMVVGLILMALDVPGKHESVNLVGLAMAAIGCVVLLYVVARFLTIRRVEVGPEGLRWSGIFGSTYRTYREISSFYRTETITNRRFVTRYVKLKFTGGGSVTLDQSLTHYSVLAESLQRIAAETLLHEKRAEWDKLGAAHFGPVTIRADGIRVNGKFITRSAISRCQIENGHLVVYGDARRRSGRERAVPLSDVPNYAVLLELLAEKAFPYVGASPHGVSC